jgi:hypothetical protein
MRFAESGLLVLGSAARKMQAAAERVSGLEPSQLDGDPPLDGPTSVDDATSEFANRVFRFLWHAYRSPQGSDLWKDLLAAARGSFGGLELTNPRQLLALPLQFPLSFVTLLAQQSLRVIHSTQVLGPALIPDFFLYMAESFNDIHVFVGLQYKNLLSRHRERVERNPDDPEARLELANTLMKMGLYPEAVREFRAAAENPDARAAALRDSAAANYRAGRFQEAIDDGVGSLTADPSSRRARYWLWLAAHKLGGFPVGVPESMRAEIRAGCNKPTVQFENVAAQIGLDKTAAGRGTAVFDMDGDGYLDIVIASAHGGCSVYRNNGDGTFTDVTVGSGLEDCVNTFIIAVGDYNNDGHDDLFITRLGFYPGESVLYRNNGDGTFTDVTREAGVGFWGASFAAHWVDYDCDGYLDLFICSNIGGIFDRSKPNRLFHNNGDGTFTEVTRQAGIDTVSPTIGCAWGDYNNDGYPDLFLSSGTGRSRLYRNDGDGTFTEVSREAGLDDIVFGSVCSWWDYDNDGKLDLLQFIWSPEDHVLETLFKGEGPPEGHPSRIFHNNGDGTFTRLDRSIGLTGCYGTMSGNFGDFNNDGNMDLLLGNGDPHMNRTEPPVLLEFDEEEGKFKDVTFAAGLPYTGKGHGSNLADLAGDGRLSLILAPGGSYPGDLLTVSVFRPKSLPGNYLNVRLVGTRSNRNAIGARLKLDAGGRGRHSLVCCGTGFGCLPYEQHFGLGTLERADALEIWWPSGLRQRFEQLPVNTTIRIVEGEQGWSSVYSKKPVSRTRRQAAKYTRAGVGGPPARTAAQPSGD